MKPDKDPALTPAPTIPKALCGYQGCVFMPHAETPDAHTHTAKF